MSRPSLARISSKVAINSLLTCRPNWLLTLYYNFFLSVLLPECKIQYNNIYKKRLAAQKILPPGCIHLT